LAKFLIGSGCGFCQRRLRAGSAFVVYIDQPDVAGAAFWAAGWQGRKRSEIEFRQCMFNKMNNTSRFSGHFVNYIENQHALV
jgi:hypothetical protein